MAYKMSKEEYLATMALSSADYINADWWGEDQAKNIVGYLDYIDNPINHGLVSMIKEILSFSENYHHWQITEKSKGIINENLRILATEKWVEVETTLA